MSVSKMIMGQAANQYVAPTYVEDVFSTDLWEGNGTARSITNGINLSGSGGLVWFKMREAGFAHRLVDTERGVTKKLESQATAAEGTEAQGLTAFNSNGFTIGTADNYNLNTYDLCSWTFRKQPKFFDIVTWTGDGTSPRNISHSLGSQPGIMIVKRTSSSEDWTVYHRSSGATKYFTLNNTNAEATFSQVWGDTEPTSTQFTVGNTARVNTSGETYVAYLFAHNDGDGDFGLTNDQDIIKCGSYTGSGQPTKEIDLGFEPQWIMVKNATDTSYGGEDWYIFDNMRGMVTGDGDDPQLFANKVDAEQASSMMEVMPTGFRVTRTTYNPNVSGETYIYMAIRRGPMMLSNIYQSSPPFDQLGQTSPSPPAFTSGFAVDTILFRGAINNNGQNPRIFDRLRGAKELNTNNTNAEVSNTFSYYDFDYSNGVGSNTGTATDLIMYMWKRAPGYFDVVAYDGGNGSSINHNLGVTPEMYWIKCRSDGSTNRGWAVYHKDATTQASQYLRLDTNDALISLGVFNNGTIDASTFSANNGYSIVNESGQTYIAHLFATVEGISKVGSYTSNGAQQNIDCGFSSGARFVFVKRTDGIGHWVLFDATRGITANSDPHLRLNDNVAQDTDGNIDIEPYSSGFTVNYGSNNLNNNTGQTYIFYAIA